MLSFSMNIIGRAVSAALLAENDERLDATLSHSSCGIEYTPLDIWSATMLWYISWREIGSILFNMVCCISFLALARAAIC
jgi:glutathione S-transferase